VVVVEGHVSPVLRQPQRDGAADSLGATSY